VEIQSRVCQIAALSVSASYSSVYSTVSVKRKRLAVLEKGVLKGITGIKGQKRHELEEISQIAS